MATINQNKIACFIHSTSMELWKDEMLTFLLEKIKNSGLHDKLDFVFVNNIGTPINENKYQDPKIIIENFSDQLNLFENFTIRSIHQFAKLHPDYKILYMHTKGITYQKDHQFVEGIISWINYMMYVLVEKHEECLQLLQVHDTVGTNYRDKSKDQTNPPHYSGNFWWTNAKYISTLPIDYMKDKYDAEFWLCKNNPLYFNSMVLHHLYQVPYSIERYKPFVDNSFEEQILLCKFGSPGIGLCNQLYSLINTILIGKSFRGHTTIIIDDFLTDINTNVYIDSRMIIDFDKMNELLESYNVTLLYKSDVSFQIKEVLFGVITKNTEDITSIVKEKFTGKNILMIPRSTDLNKLCSDGDPVPHTRKQIYITYTVNDRVFKLSHDEIILNSHDDLVLDFVTFSHLKWLSNTNIQHANREIDSFNYILKNIHYHHIFINTVKNISSKLWTENEKINIFHLRLEDDAIDFWSHINGIQPDLYKTILEQKYIRLIQEHIDIDSTTLLLSASTENAITKYMDDNGVKYLYMPKNIVEGRDTNAILDLVASQYCNSVFIGNINPNNYHGSTFSYAIYNYLRDNKNVKKICIDTDRIFDKEYIR